VDQQHNVSRSSASANQTEGNDGQVSSPEVSPSTGTTPENRSGLVTESRSPSTFNDLKKDFISYGSNAEQVTQGQVPFAVTPFIHEIRIGHDQFLQFIFGIQCLTIPALFELAMYPIPTLVKQLGSSKAREMTEPICRLKAFYKYLQDMCSVDLKIPTRRKQLTTMLDLEVAGYDHESWERFIQVNYGPLAQEWNDVINYIDNEVQSFSIIDGESIGTGVPQDLQEPSVVHSKNHSDNGSLASYHTGLGSNSYVSEISYQTHRRRHSRGRQRVTHSGRYETRHKSKNHHHSRSKSRRRHVSPSSGHHANDLEDRFAQTHVGVQNGNGTTGHIPWTLPIRTIRETSPKPRLISRPAVSTKLTWDGKRKTFGVYKRGIEGHLAMAGASYLIDDRFTKYYRRNSFNEQAMKLACTIQGSEISQAQFRQDCTWFYGAIVTTCSQNNSANTQLLRYKLAQDGIRAWNAILHVYDNMGSKDIRRN
jgi:hypothetical protein